MPSIPAVHIIDGVRVEAMGSSDTFANVNPATGEVLAEVPLDGGAAVDAAVASAAALKSSTSFFSGARADSANFVAAGSGSTE